MEPRLLQSEPSAPAPWWVQLLAVAGFVALVMWTLPEFVAVVAAVAAGT